MSEHLRECANDGFAVEFANVSKSYDDKQVLNNLSTGIPKGEFVTVIGKSGCGKTTFLKLINALIQPDSGSVFVFGNDVANSDKIALRRSIGYVIQGVGLFPNMTVRKNICYVPSLSKDLSEKSVPVEELMDIVSLEQEYLDKYPDSLSGGQQQRVGIARALAVMPEIILMDEPFGSVDEITRRQLQTSLIQIHNKLNNTIIFITHSIQEALYMGTKTMIIDNGTIAQFDTPENILSHPANEMISRLVSSMSID